MIRAQGHNVPEFVRLARALLCLALGCLVCCNPKGEPRAAFSAATKKKEVGKKALGQHVKEKPVVFAPPSEDSPGEHFSYHIKRYYESRAEAQMLSRAEQACPNFEAVSDALRYLGRPRLTRAKYEKSITSISSTQRRCRWWGGESDGDLLLPAAANKDAVAHYKRAISTWRKKPYRRGAVKMERAELRYSARIQHRERFAFEGKEYLDVEVAELRLEWTHFCGSMCGLGFIKTRTAIFLPNGEMLILGDGRLKIQWVA